MRLRTAGFLVGILGVGLLLSPGGIAADHDALQQVWESKQWFALRDAVEQESASRAFFRAAVACAFNDTKRCEREVNRFLTSGTPAKYLPAAHNLLVSLYMRQGRFRNALEHQEALLALQEGGPGRDSLRSFIAA